MGIKTKKTKQKKKEQKNPPKQNKKKNQEKNNRWDNAEFTVFKFGFCFQERKKKTLEVLLLTFGDRLVQQIQLFKKKKEKKSQKKNTTKNKHVRFHANLK